MKGNQPALVYRVTGEIVEARPRNGRTFQLDELQAIVGGYIQIIKIPDGRIMVLNEEGKFTSHGMNVEATILSGLWPNDFIVGDVLVCPNAMVR